MWGLKDAKPQTQAIVAVLEQVEEENKVEGVEPEKPNKDVMSQVAGIAKEVAQTVEALTGEALSEVDFSFPEIFEATMAEVKAEEDLGQMPVFLTR